MKAVTIAGGGLAGLALGIGLRRCGVPVTVHEAGSYPRHRVCGEFLNGEAERVLFNLGASGALDRAISHRTTAWFCGNRRIFTSDLPASTPGISRHSLDLALKSLLVSAGGTVVEHSRQPAQAREGFVWCAGRRPVRGDWVGLKCHARGLPLRADLEMHLGRGGYVGLAGVEDGAVNVCGLFRRRKDLGGRGALIGHLRACGLDEVADRLEAAALDPASFSAVAGFQTGWQGQAALSLGDACALIPPFTGNGMSMALESAEIATAPLGEYAAGKDWESVIRAIRNSVRRRFATRMFAARVAHPFLTTGSGQAFLATVSRCGFLPFRMIFHLLR